MTVKFTGNIIKIETKPNRLDLYTGRAKKARGPNVPLSAVADLYIDWGVSCMNF